MGGVLGDVRQRGSDAGARVCRGAMRARRAGAAAAALHAPAVLTSQRPRCYITRDNAL